MEKILIIDGHNLLFRMFYGIPTSIKNSRSEEIKGLIGFVGSLKKLIEKFKPYGVVVIFDSENSPKKNKEILPEYKDNRTDFNLILEDTENPFFQLPKIIEALQFLKVQNMIAVDNEADDVIASICTKYSEYQKVIVSTDKDFFQLIDKNTSVYFAMGKNSKMYDEDAFKSRYGIRPVQFSEYKALVGDKSDNILGLRGIGPKTAQKILSYESVDNFLTLSSDDKIINKISKELFVKYLKVITLDKSINVESLTNLDFDSKLMSLGTMSIIQEINQH